MGVIGVHKVHMVQLNALCPIEPEESNENINRTWCSFSPQFDPKLNGARCCKLVSTDYIFAFAHFPPRQPAKPSQASQPYLQQERERRRRVPSIFSRISTLTCIARGLVWINFLPACAPADMIWPVPRPPLQPLGVVARGPHNYSHFAALAVYVLFICALPLLVAIKHGGPSARAREKWVGGCGNGSDTPRVF